MKKIGFVIFMSLVVFIGCRKELSENSYTIENYFPLKVGNMWVYKGSYGHEDLSGQTWTATIETLKVVAQYSDSFVIEHTHRDSTIDPPYIRVSTYVDTGYFQILFSNDFLPEPQLCAYNCYHNEGVILLKEPLEIGNGWDGFQIDNMGFENKIPAGTFGNCLRVSENWMSGDGADDLEYHIYSLGVGKVEYHYNWQTGYHSSALKGWGYFQLTSYKLK